MLGSKGFYSLGVFKFLLVMQLLLDIKFYYVTFGIDVNNNLRVAVPSPPRWYGVEGEEGTATRRLCD